MKTFEFRLIFSLPDKTPAADTFLDALYEAGCDDALVGIGEAGSIALDFSRESNSAREALSSAIENVKTAIPDAGLIEASPDLVSLSDMAKYMGFSRQNMRKYYIGKTAFPKPSHVGPTNLWHLYDVVEYLHGQKKLAIPEALIEISAEAFKCNLQNQTTRYKSLLT